MTERAIERLLPEAARRAASPGIVAYTERQLYFETCRLLRAPSLSGGYPHTSEPAVAFEPFCRALGAFVAAHGPPPGLLAGPARAPLPVEEREPDLTAYGLGRIVVCRDETTARMLRANLFHMELACAVVALPSPGPIPERYRSMLARSRRATAFALHDASVEALGWLGGLGSWSDLPEGASLRPAGIRPAHAMRLRLVATRGRDRRAVEAPHPAALSPVERAWLADGWSAEIAAVPASRLLRALRRIVLEVAPPPAPAAPGPDEGFMTWP